MRTHARSLSVIVATAALTLTGCGGSKQTDVSPAGTPLTKADFASAMQHTSARDESAHVDATMRITIDTPTLAKQIGEPAPSGTPNTLSMTMHLQGDAGMVGGRPQQQMSMEFPSTSMGSGMPMPSGSMEMRLVNDVAYMKMPKGLALPGVPAGKFAKIDLTGRSALARQYQQQLKSATVSNAYATFDKGVTDVRHDGVEQVDGVDTHKYTVMVSTDAAFKAAGNAGGQSVEMMKKLGMPKEMPVQVWVDKDKRMRRELVDLRAKGMQVTMDIHASRYGQQLTVTAPPASDTVAAPQEMLDRMGASGSSLGAATPA